MNLQFLTLVNHQLFHTGPFPTNTPALQNLQHGHFLQKPIQLMIELSSIQLLNK